MTSGGTAQTISARFKPRDNALNLLRLLLAALVIVSHARPLGGLGEDPHVGDLKLGTFAVGGFFVISGYLITATGLRSPIGKFLWARFLRIMPGLWVCVLVTAFLIAPAIGALRGGWSFGDAAQFVASKATTREVHQGIGTTLAGLPLPETWNGALWTIRFELYCYLLVAIAIVIPFARRFRWLPVVAFVAATAASIGAKMLGLSIDTSTAGKLALLVPFFLAGVVLLRDRNSVPLTGIGTASAAAALAGVLAAGWGQALAPLPLGYLLLWLAVALPPRLRRFGATHDLSYGVYLYGWPTTQVLIAVGVARHGATMLMIASLVAVVPAAALSWWLVERPAMRLKSMSARTKAGQSEAAIRTTLAATS